MRSEGELGADWLLKFGRHIDHRMTQDVQLYSPDGVLYTGYNASIQLVYTHTAHSSLGSQNLLAFIEATSRLNKVTSLINH